VKPTRLLAAFLALAAILGGVALAGALGGSAETKWSFGTQAGYIWMGRVGSVSASWVVPRILDTSPCGVAATWIAAQGPGHAPSPGIQIGTSAACISNSRGKPKLLYGAFWSDAKQHGRARWLLPVNAGDLVSASLRLTNHQWALAIVDRSSGDTVHFSTLDEADASFSWAEWKQEDALNGNKGRSFPYPRLSTVRFSSLLVNSTAPSSRDLVPTWMTIDGRDFAPTRLAGDSFGLAPTHLTRLGEQYARIAAPYDAADRTFLAELSHWTLKTPRAQIVSARSSFVAALRASIDAFASEQWPRQLRATLAADIRTTRAQLAATLAPLPTSAAGLADWSLAWTRQEERIASRQANTETTLGAAARKALHLPFGPIFVSH
jgi:hypothetical protein